MDDEVEVGKQHNVCQEEVVSVNLQDISATTNEMELTTYPSTPSRLDSSYEDKRDLNNPPPIHPYPRTTWTTLITLG